MVNSEDAKTVYNQRAEKYEKSMHTFRYASSLQQAILSLPLQLPEKAKILELGCGTGITTKARIKSRQNFLICLLSYILNLTS